MIRQPPSTRRELIDYLNAEGDAVYGRIGTYDIERSGVGFMFFSRDQEQYSDLWTLVQAMGGRLEVASTPGQGSCFALVLPASAAGLRLPD